MGDVSLKITGDAAAAQKAFDHLNKQVGQLREQLATVSAEGKKGAREHADAISGLGGQLMGVVGQYLSVAGAIGAVSKALQDFHDRARDARQASVDLATAQAAAINMAGKLSPEETRGFVGRADAMTRRVLPVGGAATTYRVLETALSAAGEQDLAFRAAEVGLRLGRKSPEEATDIAGGLIDLAQITGERDMMRNAGLLVAATTQARIVTMGDVGKYGARAVKSMMTRGGTPEENFAIYATLTKGMADPTGRVSKTAAISLAEDLAEYLPEVDRPVISKIAGQIVQTGVRKGTGLKSTGERIGRLWADPKAREEFERAYVENMEKQAIGAVKGLISGPTAAEPFRRITAEQYLAIRKEIPAAAQAAEYAESKIRALEQVPEQVTATQQRAVEAGAQALKTRTLAGQRMAQAGVYGPENLAELLKASGEGWIGRMGPRLHVWGAGVGGPAATQQAFEEEVENRIGILQRHPYRGGTPEALETAAALRETLDRLRGESQIHTEILREQLEKMDQIERKRSAAGAGVTTVHSE
jgi:hypothetical protein